MSFILRWLVLALAGWLGYALATQSLGVPRLFLLGLFRFPACHAGSLARPGSQRRAHLFALWRFIGLVGGGFPWEPVLNFDDLVRDARLSRALGVREIVVFQLDGAHQQFGPDFVRRFTAAVNSPQPEVVVPFSRPASLLIYGAAVADALLDAHGLWGWLWIAWAIVCVFTVRARRCP